MQDTRWGSCTPLQRCSRCILQTQPRRPASIDEGKKNSNGKITTNLIQKIHSNCLLYMRVNMGCVLLDLEFYPPCLKKKLRNPKQTFLDGIGFQHMDAPVLAVKLGLTYISSVRTLEREREREREREELSVRVAAAAADVYTFVLGS